MKLDIHTSHNMKSILISGESIFVPRASSFRGSGASGRSNHLMMRSWDILGILHGICHGIFHGIHTWGLKMGCSPSLWQLSREKTTVSHWIQVPQCQTNPFPRQFRQFDYPPKTSPRQSETVNRSSRKFQNPLNVGTLGVPLRSAEMFRSVLGNEIPSLSLHINMQTDQRLPML